MSKKDTRTATPPREYAGAMDKLRDEMAASKDEKIRLLGEGLTAMLRLHPEWEANILKDGRTIKGALDMVRKKATGGCSDPIRTTRSLCEYYGLDCGDVHRLTLEVTRAMIGEGEETGDTSSDTCSGEPCSPRSPGQTAPQTYAPPQTEPDPFDLDALLGGVL